MIRCVIVISSYFDIITCRFRRNNKVKDIAFDVRWLCNVLHESKLIYEGLQTFIKNAFTAIDMNIKVTNK